MSLPRLLVIVTGVLFSAVLVAALVKTIKKPQGQKKAPIEAKVEIKKENETRPPAKKIIATAPNTPSQTPKTAKTAPVKPVRATASNAKPATNTTARTAPEDPLPEVNRVAELFSIDGPKLPIVETIVYKSRVLWQQGRPAWLVDYARHYQTSRHFIARSLNGRPDYFKQDLVENARFNVYRKDKEIAFYLLVDLSRCKMWLYYDDLATKERVLLKTYRVGVGRVDDSKISGLLTPLGKYTLGNKVAIYKPKMMGHYNGESVEMITVFGTRWIPFDKAVGQCSSPAKGLGIHGVPWFIDADGEKVQDASSIGKYQSDGCIRLASEDVDELFAIVISKPTVIELVKDYYDVNKK